MPAFKSNICTMQFMFAIRNNKLWIPMQKDVKITQVAKSKVPPRAELAALIMEEV